MSARVSVAPSASTSVGVPQAFLRTSRAEWSRLWSVRSTWWFALATAGAGLGIGLLLGLDAAGKPEANLPAEGAFAGDHASGGIVPSLQWTPRRGVLLAARTTVITATVTLYGLLVVTAAGLLVRVLVPAFGLPADGTLAVLGDVSYGYVTCILMAVGLGLLLRSTPGGLVSVIALVIVIPLIFGNLPFEPAQRIAEYVPGTSVITLIVDEGNEVVSDDRARLTLAVWALGSMLLGSARLLRSDAGQ